MISSVLNRTRFVMVTELMSTRFRHANADIIGMLNLQICHSGKLKLLSLCWFKNTPILTKYIIYILNSIYSTGDFQALQLIILVAFGTFATHYGDVIMREMASQITSVSIVCQSFFISSTLSFHIP